MPPLVGVAVKVTLVPAQIVVALAATVTLTGKLGFTFIVIPALVNGLPVAHVAFEVRTTVTTSPLVSVVLLNVLLFAPTLIVFTFHCYEGIVPPLVGVAVKVTLVPEQIVVALAATLTLTGKLGLTIIVTPTLVAGLFVAHVALEVNTTVTTSLLISVVVLNVLLFAPALIAFTFH